MTAKQYLEQLSTLDRMLSEKLDQIYRLRNTASNPSCYIGGERVQTSMSGDRMADIVAKIVMLEEECDTLQDRYADLRRTIITKTNMLSGKHKDIIRKRYIEKKTIHAIAQDIGMTDRGLKKAHKRALEEFTKIMQIRY